MKKHMSRSTLVMVLLDIVLGVVLSLYIANTGTMRAERDGTVTVQVPALAKPSSPAAVTVHTDGVDDAKRSGRPESTEATSVGVVPNACAPGLAKVITWVTAVVTSLEAADDGPVPALLVAFTVKV